MIVYRGEVDEPSISIRLRIELSSHRIQLVSRRLCSGGREEEFLCQLQLTPIRPKARNKEWKNGTVGGGPRLNSVLVRLN